MLALTKGKQRLHGKEKKSFSVHEAFNAPIFDHH